MSKPIIFAHRGANRMAPENTMSAFAKAHELGACAIEFDVQLSKDLVPVIIHDTTLERTTNGHGLVSAHTFAELQQLSAGLWFNEVFADEKIPSLQQALAKLIPFGMYINIEIKPNDLSVDDLVQAVLHCLQQMNCPKEQILLSSFNREVLQVLAKNNSAWARALLINDQNENEDVFQCAIDYQCENINPSVLLLQTQAKNFIDAAHEQGLKVFSYTINDEAQAQQLLALGLDGFFTDDDELYTQGVVVTKE